MSNRNVDKGREAENAAAAVFQRAGCLHAERRSKRGGTVDLPCTHCAGGGVMDAGHGLLVTEWVSCQDCEGTGTVGVPADAGDLTGIPGVVVQVKWSPYRPLAQDLQRTDEQRRVAGADIGLLVRKRKGVGLARAAEWDAYLPAWQLAQLYAAVAGCADHQLDLDVVPDPQATWHTDLGTAARLIAHAGYGTPEHSTR